MSRTVEYRRFVEPCAAAAMQERPPFRAGPSREEPEPR